VEGSVKRASDPIMEAIMAVLHIRDGLEGLISETGSSDRYWQRRVERDMRKHPRSFSPEELASHLDDLVDGLEGLWQETGDITRYWKRNDLKDGHKALESLKKHLKKASENNMSRLASITESIVADVGDVKVIEPVGEGVSKTKQRVRMHEPEAEASDRWLTADQVAKICPSCAERMAQRGMTRIKASVIEDARRQAGIMLKPERIVKELDSAGISLDRQGGVLFAPLSPIGIPVYGTAFRVKDIEAAVRQTSHVKESNEDKIGSFGKLLDKLSRLGKFLRIGDPTNREALETSLDIFDMDVEPLMPSQKVRNRDMVSLRDDLKTLRADIERGDFRDAQGIIQRSFAAIENLRVSWSKQIEAWVRRRKLLMALRNMLRNNPEIGPYLVTASVKTAAAQPNIGPGVALQGKQGVYKLSFGPSKLDAGPHGYNRSMNEGYTHWLRLESPRGAEFEFYWRPDQPDTVFLHKSHRTTVPMKFKNAKLPPDIKEIARHFPNDRELSRLYSELQKFRLEMIDSGLPQAEKVAEMLRDVLKDMEALARSIGEARGAMYASRKAGVVPGVPDGTGPYGRRNRREDGECLLDEESRTAAKWETMPKGWTDESRKKFWENLTSRAPKHKVTQCIKEMTGKVGDPGAFCSALADRVLGTTDWRGKD